MKKPRWGCCRACKPSSHLNRLIKIKLVSNNWWTAITSRCSIKIWWDVRPLLPIRASSWVQIRWWSTGRLQFLSRRSLGIARLLLFIERNRRSSRTARLTALQNVSKNNPQRKRRQEGHRLPSDKSNQWWSDRLVIWINRWSSNCFHLITSQLSVDINL